MNEEKYTFTPEMREISGFGGSYEEKCRKMLKTGLEWFDDHPNADPHFSGFKDVVGICSPEDEDAKSLEKAIVDAVDDFTFIMFQVVIETIFYIQQQGWDEYKKIMSKKEE